MNQYVLFVDDEPENLAVFEAQCADRFPVLTTTTAACALELLRQHEVAVLVADQRMPKVTGLELLEQAQAEFPQVVRMLVTAYADLETAVNAINRGKVRRYLRKPWEFDELLATLTEGVDYYQMRAKLSALERRLFETERVYSLGVITAGLAREVRAPVGGISDSVGRARKLVRWVVDSGAHVSGVPAELRAKLLDADEELGEAETCAKRLLDVVSGVEISTGPSSEQRADASEVLRLTLRLMQNELRQAGSLEIDVRPVPFVAGSAAQLGQVVLNLLVNALDGMAAVPREHRRLAIRLAYEEPWVKIEIADSGPALTADLLSQDFDPWKRADGPRGLGLGLAISRTIAGDIGGRLEAENGARGAVFRLLLPTRPGQ
jgi:C4-dicarboxylate-specific signal transduction histidine kinase